MKTTSISILALVLVLCLSDIGRADLVDISVATDKPTYQVGEEVKVYVRAYNPGLDSVTLTFGSNIQTSYWMDDIYDWQAGRDRLWVLTYATINPNTTHTWELIHGSYEMSVYPLEIGTHSVVGIVGAYELSGNGESSPIEFEVIPEPASLIILTTGSLWIFRYSRSLVKH